MKAKQRLNNLTHRQPLLDHMEQIYLNISSGSQQPEETDGE